MLTFEIFSLDDNYLDWMITTQLDDNYQEVVIIQWYCSYHPVLSFDVWLHWNRNSILGHWVIRIENFDPNSARFGKYYSIIVIMFYNNHIKEYLSVSYIIPRQHQCVTVSSNIITCLVVSTFYCVNV